MIFVGIALLATASCTQDEVRDTYRGNAIDFRAAIDTKGIETTTSTLNEVSKSFYATAIDGNNDIYFNNLEFTFDAVNDVFVSDPVYYWPASGNLTFYAWYPADAAEDITVDNNQQTITFIPKSTIADQVDFVAVKTEGSNTSEGMALEFEHILSQIQINAKNTNDGYVYNVKGIKIANVASSGTYSFNNDPEWDSTNADKVTYQSTYDTPITLDNTSKSIMSADEGNAMLVPQQLTAWDGSGPAFVPEDPAIGTTNLQTGAYLAVLVNVKTDAQYQIYPEDTSNEEEYGWIAVAIDKKWEPGVKYIYILDFTDGAGVDESTNEPVLNTSIKFSYNISISGWSGFGGYIN